MSVKVKRWDFYMYVACTDIHFDSNTVWACSICKNASYCIVKYVSQADLFKLAR